MRFLLKQKLWQRQGRFTIEDAAGNEVLTSHPALLRGQWNVTFRDPSGADLLTIEQRVFTNQFVFELYRGSQCIAVVEGGRDHTKWLGLRWGTGKPGFEFSVDVPGPDDLVARGSVDEHEYTLVRGDTTVATVSKTWFSFDDSYGVEVADGEDVPLILASTVVIDMAIGMG